MLIIQKFVTKPIYGARNHRKWFEILVKI